MNLKGLKDKARGMMVGLAVGDALGAPMALCLADSLLAKQGYDSYDIMDKFSAWEFSGYRSFFPMGYGVGVHTDESIVEYSENPIIEKNTPETESIANGSMMRLAPIVLANTKNSIENILELAKLSARETHNSTGAMAMTELLAASLYLILTGCDKKSLLKKSRGLIKDPRMNQFLDETADLHERINDSKGDSLRDLGGYAVDCYDIAMWGLTNFDRFYYGMLGVRLLKLEKTKILRTRFEDDCNFKRK